MDRRRYSPGRRSARLVAVAALSALAVCASPHGGWLTPVPVLAHKPPPPTPVPTATPIPTPPPTATPAPTPAPTPKPTEKPQPSPTAEHHAAGTLAPAAAPAASTAGPPSAAPSAAAPQHTAPGGTPVPTHLVQQTSVPTALASFAENRHGQLSGYVLGADVLAGVAVMGSLALAELRRRRLV